MREWAITVSEMGSDTMLVSYFGGVFSVCYFIIDQRVIGYGGTTEFSPDGTLNGLVLSSHSSSRLEREMSSDPILRKSAWVFHHPISRLF